AAARAADGCCQQFDADVAILLAWGMRPRVLGVSGSVQLDPRSEAAAAACELASRGPAVLKDRRWWLAEATERRSGQPAGAGQTAGPSPQGPIDSVLQSKVDRLANTLRLRCILMIRSAEAATPWLLLGFQDRREAEAIVRGLEEGFGSRVPRGPALFLSALERLVLKIATHRPAGRLLSAGQWLQPLTGRRPWTRMLSGLVAACLVGAIAFFPVAEQVPATAILTPQSKLVYYAPHSGLIERVLVTDGQQVVPGTPLVHIASRELERQSAAVDGEIEITRRKLESARWLRNRGDRLPDREVDQLESEIRQLEATLGSLTHQRQLLLEQIAELEVRAVAPGRVLTWNLAQRLTNRPVSMGHPLVATFDPAGPWQLEVSIPDYRAGIVARALETEAGALPCQVVFTSHPGKIVPAELTTMADVAMRLPNAARQPQHVIPAIAHVAPGNLPLHKDGAVARVVIDCGRTPLGWLVCRDAFWSLSSWIRMLW
ncbi:MAG: biotin/lipoyl-binding protein, partial [Planctomycetota bacterium]